MKARTIYAPYAWAVYHDVKHYETVSRNYKIRGTVAIHAAKTMPKHASVQFFHSLLQETKDLTFIETFSPDWLDSLPRGMILGTVEIVDCVPVETIRTNLPPLERAFGNYTDGRYVLVLKNPQPFGTPIPAKGQQGWWNWNSQSY